MRLFLRQICSATNERAPKGIFNSVSFLAHTSFLNITEYIIILSQ